MRYNEQIWPLPRSHTERRLLALPQARANYRASEDDRPGTARCAKASIAYGIGWRLHDKIPIGACPREDRVGQPGLAGDRCPDRGKDIEVLVQAGG